jgi:hypothetical protein
METLGPLYDHLKPSRVKFHIAQLTYFLLQGLIVGLFPRNSPRKLTETLGTIQWILSIVQPLLLVALEVIWGAGLRFWEPYQDVVEGKLQKGVNVAKGMVLLMVTGFVLPSYKYDPTLSAPKSSSNSTISSSLTNAAATRGVSASSFEDSLTPDALWTAKDVLAYLAGFTHSVLLVFLISLIVRKIYLWVMNFVRSRKAAGKLTGSRERGRRRRWTLMGSSLGGGSSERGSKMGTKEKEKQRLGLSSGVQNGSMEKRLVDSNGRVLESGWKKE